MRNFTGGVRYPQKRGLYTCKVVYNPRKYRQSRTKGSVTNWKTSFDTDPMSRNVFLPVLTAIPRQGWRHELSDLGGTGRIIEKVN
ncbi:hypothetical protein [Desulfosporosinus shakirovi]|uniref:hypothetical protein n=1 Tax=Desulfosporosinus shakirovi TaxID=2885154 RepID=UPI001E617ACD|nr:hypothetical protein [Desulfosporosinus sp. SRJS8]MCB8815797.1 hypothetical protein [Desulfosporosinus sp. SRJS8]